MRIAHISIGGQDYEIMAGGKRFHFEAHPYCGPVVLDSHSEVLEMQPGPRSAFWEAARLWNEQGKRVDQSTGLCIWDHEPEPILEHLGGKHYRITGYRPAVRGD